MRLSTRFAICLAVAVPLLVLLAGLLVHALVSHDLRTERDRQLTVRLRALAPMASVYAWRARATPGIPPDFLQRRLSEATAGDGGAGGMYLEIAGAEPLVIGDVPHTLPPAGTAGPADFVDLADLAEAGRTWRFVAEDLGARENHARLWVFDPQTRLDAQLGLLRRRVGLTALVSAGVGALAGLALGRFAVRPLEVLHRQARLIGAPSRPGARLATTSGVSEIDELAGMLNTSLDRRDAAVARTGEALETARAFAATAAHELRTPLTSMTANLGLLDHPDVDATERAEILADLRAEQGRMQRLITALRQLARGELLGQEAFTEIDVVEIVGDAVEDARRRHPHAAITVSLPDRLVLTGWAEGVRGILDNLLDNAAVHGTDGGGACEISVGVREDGAAALLTVRDSGPGIPPADRESVFARFHRRVGSPGSGLGLTVVRQHVLLHGGSLRVTDPHAGTGTRVEVRLPRHAVPAAPQAGSSWRADRP
ncbi:HAMP domain-containing sensor histidine kinase [Microbispora sp. H11081]|uniref:sensor histidine kinase n=1 Tax=Microbispora sp. H11081 TaxID=2729107 RepID=UPI00147677C6|nr:HAMP domain-containing sensor histidine kinase [Microbispora sp. H11081]